MRVKNESDELSAWKRHMQEHWDFQSENVAGGCSGGVGRGLGEGHLDRDQVFPRSHRQDAMSGVTRGSVQLVPRS